MMRLAVFAVTGLQLLIAFGFGINMTRLADTAQTLISGQVTLVGMAIAVLMVPALILAIVGRAVGLALALSIVSLLVLLMGLSQF